MRRFIANSKSQNPCSNLTNVISDNTIVNNNVIMFDKIYESNSLKKHRCTLISNSEMQDLSNVLISGIYKITDKQYAKDNLDMLKACYEIGCNILYNRHIQKNVIEKQKQYDVEYIVDFFKYILRIFLKRYDSTVVLTKNQCYDIKTLCKVILENSDSGYKDSNILTRVSSKEIIESIKKINI